MNAVFDVGNTASTAPAHSYHILVVDDDPDTLVLETKILEQVGFRVDLAKDGEAAWRALQTGAYDLLITDHLMPKVSGLALVRQLRVAGMMLPAVMVSATNDAIDGAKLMCDPWSHIHAFVYKPFTVSELLSAVHSALQLPKPA